MNPYKKFRDECVQEISDISVDTKMLDLSRRWMNRAQDLRYSYHFEWLGRPLIQYPQDVLAMQEIIWQVQPDLIVETGVAHGGSLVFYASMLELIGKGEVLGIDIEIRPHNREAIEAHPMSKRISLLEGSSIDPDITEAVEKLASGKRVMVVLDSNHTHGHVAAELKAYAPLVDAGSYCVVMDTVIEDMPDRFFSDRPWGKGDNPKTAVWDFLQSNPDFEVDKQLQNKLLLTVAPDGYLRRMR